MVNRRCFHRCYHHCKAQQAVASNDSSEGTFTMPRTTRARAVEAPSMSMNNFTRVAKTQTFVDSAKKAINVLDAQSPAATNSRKRKASTAISRDDDATHVNFLKRNISFSPSDEEDDAGSKRACRREEPAPTARPILPAKGKKVAAKKEERSHRPASKTLLSSSRRDVKSTQVKIDSLYNKRQAAAKQTVDASLADLPTELADLVRLHRAFIRTLLIQMAHGRNDVPLDLREMAPNVARAWGKRAVTVEDVRRCIAVEGAGETPSPFAVTDYGKGKICVELRTGFTSINVKEKELCTQFEENLRRMCSERATDEMQDVEVPLDGLSLADLPQADVKTMNLASANPLFAKAHKTLDVFKNDLVAKQAEKVTQQSSAAIMVNADGSKMSLLDRLRHKQLAAASSPAGPTAADNQRKAALSRVPDVAATISMLSLTNPISLPRCAFTMAAITEKLRDSLRVPMAKEEGIQCIHLIAKEIAPEWLKVVTIGGRENVVIQRRGEPVRATLDERTKKLLGN